jgi:type II secretion system protein H
VPTRAGWPSAHSTLNTRNSTLRGFTLIELILVLVILTIVVGAIAPSLRGFGIGRTRSDAATLVVTLANYARQQAVTEARAYRLNFDPAARAVWLTADAGDGTFAAPPGDYGQRFTAPDGVTLSTDAPQQTDGQYVTFSATGRTDPCQVTLTDRLGNTSQIACRSATELFAVVNAGGGR